jgi:hypothetical protein
MFDHLEISITFKILLQAKVYIDLLQYFHQSWLMQRRCDFGLMLSIHYPNLGGPCLRRSTGTHIFFLRRSGPLPLPVSPVSFLMGGVADLESDFRADAVDAAPPPEPSPLPVLPLLPVSGCMESMILAVLAALAACAGAMDADAAVGLCGLLRMP